MTSYFYRVSPQKSWHFWIFCQIKNVKHFREISYVWMAEGLIYHMTPKNLKIIHARVSTSQPENDSQRVGRGGGGLWPLLSDRICLWQNYYHNGVGAGRRQGDCLGGGAKFPKCLATAARAIKFCANPEKVAQRGGGGGGGAPTHFPPQKIIMG